MLKDDYYIGVLTFEGAKNPDGLHPPLIDRDTLERVQQVLRAHALSGDRSHKHHHYLSRARSSGGQCGGRLLYAPVTVQARGQWNGRPVEYRQSFSNTCLMEARTGAVFALES